MILQKERFRANLVLLNDVLQASDIASDYWIWGGLLLGWARERQILDHDCHDADFAFLSRDSERFRQSMGRLIQAGFEPLACWVNNAHEITEYTFAKDDAKFEFFEMHQTGDTMRFFTYSPAAALQTTNLIRAHGLEIIDFLGRRWLKPADHDSYLTDLYGDWRKPDPSWDWLEDDKSIREVARWVGTTLPIADRAAGAALDSHAGRLQP
ncbi:MAG: hypothetical protein M3Z35_07840 [Nitrospirota bacterium]|nr:hypothetical protein [Nitrospirota bacterium]